MVEKQKYNEDLENRKASGQKEGIKLIEYLTDRYYRGEITLTEMWAKIDGLIDAHHFRKNMLEPIKFPGEIFNKQSDQCSPSV